jgi:hypothetical protein
MDSRRFTMAFAGGDDSRAFQNCGQGGVPDRGGQGHVQGHSRSSSAAWTAWARAREKAVEALECAIARIPSSIRREVGEDRKLGTGPDGTNGLAPKAAFSLWTCMTTRTPHPCPKTP